MQARTPQETPITSIGERFEVSPTLPDVIIAALESMANSAENAACVLQRIRSTVAAALTGADAGYNAEEFDIQSLFLLIPSIATVLAYLLSK